MRAITALIGLLVLVASVGLIKASSSEAATGSISGQAFILNGSVLGLVQANIGRVTLPASGADADATVVALGVGPAVGVGVGSVSAALTSGTGVTHCEGDPGGSGETVIAECTSELEDLDMGLTLTVGQQTTSLDVLSADLLRAVSHSQGTPAGLLSSTSAGSVFTNLCVLQSGVCATVNAAGVVTVSGDLSIGPPALNLTVHIGGTVEVFQDDQTLTASSVSRSVTMLAVNLTLSATATVGQITVVVPIETPVVQLEIVRADSAVAEFVRDVTATATPVQTETPVVTSTPNTTVTATASPTTTATATVTSTVTATATATATQTATPSATATAAPTSTASATPSAVASASPSSGSAGGSGTGGTPGAAGPASGAGQPRVTPQPPRTGSGMESRSSPDYLAALLVVVAACVTAGAVTTRRRI